MEESKKVVKEALEEVDGGRRAPESDLTGKPSIDLVTPDDSKSAINSKTYKPTGNTGICRPLPKCKPSSSVV
jgi:hypothetical protein